MDERELAIRTLLPIVRSLARAIARKVPTCEFDDLVSEGTLGAIRAVDTFDHTRGVPLQAYARRLVFGSMLNGVRRMDGVPEHVRREARLAERARFEIYARTGRPPRLREIAAAVGIEPRRLMTTLARASRSSALSLDEPLPPRVREPSIEEDPLRALCLRERRRTLAQAVDDLPSRERYVVREHYFRCTTFDLLGQRLGVTRQRASQIHVRALRRLRDRLTRVSVA